MKRGGKILAYGLSALAFGNGAQALVSDSPDGPYHGIVARNVFDVHPAPPVDTRPPPPITPPPPNIRLQGITDILHKKQVIFKVVLPPKPPAPAKEESFILTEGQREGEIEILEIDVKAGTVKVNNYGTITNLSMEHNAEKLAGGSPAGAPPQLPGAQLPPPSFVPPTLPTLPTGRTPPRTLRLPGAAGAQGNPVNPGFPGGTTPNYSGGNSYQQPQAELTADQAGLILAAQKLEAQQRGDPIQHIIPLPPQLMKEFEKNQNPNNQTPDPTLAP